jgi:hypothetical protein
MREKGLLPMSKAAELLEQARGRRDLARRAKRWARELSPSDETEIARLLRYSDELEEQASSREKLAAALMSADNENDS